MNLAANSKDRVKLIIAGVIGVVVVVYALIAFVVAPARARRAETVEQIEGLEGDIERAWKIVKRVNAGQASHHETLAAVMEEAEGKGYVLHPRLGNYLLPASEFLHACAGKCGVEVQTIAEGPLSAVPQTTSRKTPNAFRTYTVRVGVECGYEDFVGFVKCIEENNPYVCLCALNITGQGGRPEKHTIGFDLQWPIWADLETPKKIKEELAKSDDTSEDAGVEAGS
jgi:hypothetical protein